MHAVSFSELTGPAALSLLESPDPVPAAGEVLVAIEAATINPVDSVVIGGGMKTRMPGSAPWVTGWDGAGTIAAVGADVDASLVGKPVLAFSAWFTTGVGLQADRAAVPLGNVAVASGTLKPAVLTTFGLNGLTALHVLRATGLESGARLAVTGASGGVGGFVVELARNAGIEVYELTRDTTDDELSALGVDALVNAAPANERWLLAIKDGGVFRSVTGVVDPVRGIDVARVGVVPDAEGLARIVELAQAGVLSARVGREFPASEARAAYEAFGADRTHDRIVLTF